jgi:hypothetical protein
VRGCEELPFPGRPGEGVLPEASRDAEDASDALLPAQPQGVRDQQVLPVWGTRSLCGHVREAKARGPTLRPRGEISWAHRGDLDPQVTRIHIQTLCGLAIFVQMGRMELL